MTTVLLVEDQTMMRDAVASPLALEDDMPAGGPARSPAPRSRPSRPPWPDVALLDIELPDVDGLSVAEMLATTAPSCRVVIVTTFGRPGYLRRAMAANVAGFVLKETPAEELASVIRRAHLGERIVDPALAVSALREGDDPLTAP